MKKRQTHLGGILLVLVLGICAIQATQKSSPNGYFEGTITYAVSFSGPQSQLLQENEPNTQMDIHLKGGDYIINLKGGQVPKTFLFIADSNREYIVEASKGVAYKFSKYSDRIYHDGQEEPPTAQATGKKAEVNGVVCDIFLLKKPDTYFAYYVHDDYRVNLDAFPENCNSNASFLVQGLEGRIPLKTIKKQKGLTVTTTYQHIKPQTFSRNQFLIPPSFEILNRDYRY